jgi:hypothetical protein
MRETTALTLVGKALSHPLRERMLAGLVVSRQEGVRVMWRVADPQLPKVLDRLAELTREKVT